MEKQDESWDVLEDKINDNTDELNVLSEDVKIPKSAGVLATPWTDFEDDEDSPKEETKYKSDKLSLQYESDAKVKGSIEITTKKLLWKNNDSEILLQFSYQDFVLHAISRNETPCILAQLKIENYSHLYQALYNKEEVKSDSDSDEDDYIDPDPPEKTCALYFIPDNESELDAIFDAFSECSKLNPDVNSDTNENDNLYTNNDFDFSDFMFDINNIDQLQMQDDGRFDDAQEDEGTNKDTEEAKKS